MLFRSKRPVIFQPLLFFVWLLLVLWGLTSGWLGASTVDAATQTATMTRTDYTVNHNSAQEYPVGVEVTFTVTINNPGPAWMSVVPISVTYASEYLTWVRSQPLPTMIYPAAIRWDDLTTSLGDIAPAHTTTLTLTLKAVQSTENLAGGVTNISIQIKGGQSDPDGPGPNNSSTAIPAFTLTIPVTIKTQTAPPALPKGVERSTEAVTVAWQTSDETNILGFNLLRQFKSGSTSQVNALPLAAQHSGTPQGGEYLLVDRQFSLLQQTNYQLEVLLSNGETIQTEMGTLAALPIALAESSIGLTADGITAQWQTMDETYIKGFDLFRYQLASEPITTSAKITTPEPPLTQVNASLISALHAGETTGASYKFVDPSTRIGGGGGYGYKLRILVRSGETLMVDIGSQKQVEISITANGINVEPQKTTVHWNTFNELVITGFNVLRHTASQNQVQVNAQPITAEKQGAASGAEYSFVDTTADPQTSYVYTIEVLLVDNSSIHYELTASSPLHQIFLPAISG